ncbi:MAG: transcription-repair coupling factor [Christensenellales bacterium]
MNNFITARLKGPSLEKLKTIVRGGGACSAFGMPDSYKAALCTHLLREEGRPLLYLTANEQSAFAAAENFDVLGVQAACFPAREIRITGAAARSNDAVLQRTQILAQIGKYHVVTASIDALLPPLVPGKVFRSAAISLREGDEADTAALIAALMRMGYVRTPMVEGVGQYSLRGGILDCFPPGESAVRMEFFGDTVDSLRRFDADTQRSVGKIRQVRIAPVTEAPLDEKGRGALIEFLSSQTFSAGEQAIDRLEQYGYYEEAFQFLPACYDRCATILDYMRQPLVVLDEAGAMREHAANLRLEYLENHKVMFERGLAVPAQAGFLFDYDEIVGRARKAPLVATQTIRGSLDFPVEAQVSFPVQSLPHYHGSMEALAQDLRRYRGENLIVACVPSTQRARRLQKELEAQEFSVFFGKDSQPEALGQADVLILRNRLKNGFYSPQDAFLLLGENDISVSKQTARPLRKKGRMDLFVDLAIGDYVVHDSYGIGVYRGMEKVCLDDVSHDYMVVEYSAGDKLKVPAEQMNRVQKYIGADGATLRLSRLGGQDWNRAKKRVQDSVKELAFDLAQLYAQRQSRKGFAFSKDTPWQMQFEDNFPYDETPGQKTCIQEIKRDMESSRVMDRLLCGDVGYGKTEVAMRAAFKAVMDSKQVAFLVPTTILAQQHYNNLVQRFEGFPVRIAMLSRFSKAAEQKETLRRLELGELDILVGTHKILGRNVSFHDLGLLIVDEEQRFGVGHKETIKNIKTTVDVLTLSATPIPRTLHMSLSGIRDMSVIETPPQYRYPVQTYVMEYSEEMVKDAIAREVGRHGQAFFVFNDVRAIDQFRMKLLELMPQMRIAIAHGQMDERLLERTMLRFSQGDYDVLLCSTIIESGMDLPNVNTLVVYDADRFGLSQLYQLKGRVGRSNRLAYAYFMFRPDKVISEVARKRLVAVRDFTELGSGFKIAMRDLEIRGAGNVLGPQQHGHMAEVGYEMYARMLEEAVRDLRGEVGRKTVDALIDARIDAHIPVEYIGDEPVRVEAYKRIASIVSEEDLSGVWEELEDRFSPPPEPVQNLMMVSLVKAYASRCFITNVGIKQNFASLRFAADAPIDSAALIRIAGGVQGGALVGQEITVLQIRSKADVETMMQKVVEVLRQLIVCNEQEISV